MVKIKSVLSGSSASRVGICAGDTLISINSNPIRDVLDFRFYICEKKLELELLRPNGEKYKVKIKKDEYDDIGLEFDTFLMDKQQRCANKCIFCFIDQNPHSMREGIYFKDDDTRLSFLFGNYVTLTNVGDEELYRLVKMRISPVNISVHVTDAQRRRLMLGNKNAGKILSQMEILANGGLDINVQIVLCKGVNDGEYLEKSLSDLEKFNPHLKSIAVVPVGLTKYRNGLYPLEAFTGEEAGEVIDLIEKKGEYFLEKYGSRIVFASDEFYLKASRPLPDGEFYEEYPQLENGVGMLSSMKEEVLSELEFAKEECDDFSQCRKISIATGKASFEHISFLIEKIKDVWYNIDCSVYPIHNDFYGDNVTVSGLMVGADIISQLKGKALGTHLYVSRSALRHEGDLFLDGVSVEDVEKELCVKLVTVDSDSDFLYKIIKE